MWLAGWLVQPVRGRGNQFMAAKKLEQESAKNCYIVWGCIKVADMYGIEKVMLTLLGMWSQKQWQLCRLSPIHGMAM